MPGCPLCGCPGTCTPVDAFTWVDLDAYAELTSVSRATVWRWRRLGYLHARRGDDGRIQVREQDERRRFGPVDVTL